MRITVIPADRLIRRDEQAVNLPDWPFDDDEIHAVQWYDSWGEIEKTGYPKPQNEVFTDLTVLSPYLDLLDTFLLSQQSEEGQP